MGQPRNPKRPPRRTYTPAERAAAVEMARTRGVSYAAAESDVKPDTLKKWMQRAGVHVSPERTVELPVGTRAAVMSYALRRAQLADDAGAAAQEALEHVRTMMATGSWFAMQPAAHAARVFAIMVDKAQLLSGGSTSRPDLAGDKLDAEVAEIVEQLEAMEG